ncbi:MFS transporter [Nocardiopsis changdeensis]|uniref:MFS transporter n=1 Tax=Nocardiopsis changdeensis TaxID=2831969 RepID=A0ABX8BUN5_9ACTN|nr:MULTISPECIES: MFS transporter [Nocardiopsis]QUX24083.1 MFS transporter [Nocardiopsis changdeensis]QYX34479.1 MFS transporter [Nocardiopsis sp. MT53]
MTSPTEPRAAARTGYLRVLAVPEFRVLFLAEVLAILGQVAAQMTLSLTVYTRTGSPLLSALAFAMGFLPHLLGATLLSALTDRVPARGLMVLTQGATALLVVGMAVPGTPIAVMLLLMFVMGAIAPLYQGTKAATVADVLPPEGFALGRSLLRMAAQLAQICGFAFGGVLFAVLSPTPALLAGAGLLLASCLLLRLGLPAFGPRRSPEAAQSSPVADSLRGVREVLRSPRLRVLLALTWFPPVLGVAAEALAAPLADALGGGPALVAMLLSATPVGMIAGTFLAGTLLTDAQRVRAIVPLGLLAFLPLLGLGLHPGPVALLALLVLSGAGYGYALGVDRLLVAAVPEQERGQVMTLVTAGLMIFQGAGFALAGALAEFLSPNTVVVLAALAGIAVVLAAGTRAGRP